MYNIFYQSHAGSWAILIIFFLLSYFFHNQKWLSIITRIFYLMMIVTGVGMLFLLKFPLVFIVKGLLAILLIGTMDMILMKKKKAQPHSIFWIVFVIILILVILLGFHVIHF